MFRIRFHFFSLKNLKFIIIFAQTTSNSCKMKTISFFMKNEICWTNTKCLFGLHWEEKIIRKMSIKKGNTKFTLQIENKMWSNLININRSKRCLILNAHIRTQSGTRCIDVDMTTIVTRSCFCCCCCCYTNRPINVERHAFPLHSFSHSLCSRYLCTMFVCTLCFVTDKGSSPSTHAHTVQPTMLQTVVCGHMCITHIINNKSSNVSTHAVLSLVFFLSHFVYRLICCWVSAAHVRMKCFSFLVSLVFLLLLL